MKISFPHPSLLEDWKSGLYSTGVTEPWTQQVVAAILTASNKYSVLELGTYLGHTTVWLADALKYTGGKVTSVELDPERCEAAKERLTNCVGGDNWTVVQSDSLAFLREQPVGAYDFVWVDDDHTLSHVAEEMNLLLDRNHQIVAKGGIVLMHDVIGPHALGGICKRWHGTILDFPKLGTDGGLGVIQVSDL